MSDILLNGSIAPNGPFASSYDYDNFGGFRVVADLTARNAIITARRIQGMWVKVQSDSNVYELLPSPWDGTNADWELAPIGSSLAGGTGINISVSGGVSTIALANTAITPATYGDSSHVSQVTFDQQGRATGASNVAISIADSAITYASHAANLVFATATSGGSAAPTFRSLVAGDIPNIAESQVTGLVSDLAAKATDSLVVHLAGTETITGQKTFPAAGANAVRIPAIYAGSSNTNGHAIPNVADDTFALLAASQTLASKTMTAPVINGATSSGSTALDFSGNSGAFKTSTGAVTIGGGSSAIGIDATAAITIGGTHATSIAIGNSGITTAITGGLTQLTGAVSLTGNAASSLTTSSGSLTLSGASGINLQYNGSTSYAIGSTGSTLTPAIQTSGSPTLWTLTAPAHTTLAASTEAIDINWNLARTVQFSTGALTTQRAAVFQAPTYGFVGSSTLTNAATVAITGAPAQGTNATITNAWAMWTQSGASYLQQNSIATAQTIGLQLGNETAAVTGAGNQQYSPALALYGQGWHSTGTAVSRKAGWIVQAQPVEGVGTEPTVDLVYYSSIDGTNSEILRFQSGSTVRFSNVAPNTIGVAQATGTTVQGQTLNITGSIGSVGVSTNAGGQGGLLSFIAGTGGDSSGASGAAGRGGQVTIQGGIAGAAAGGTGALGGNIVIDAGTGSTGNGTISIGNTNNTAITIGKSGSGQNITTNSLFFNMNAADGLTVTTSTTTSSGALVALKIACANNIGNGNNQESPALWVADGVTTKFDPAGTLVNQRFVRIDQPTIDSTTTGGLTATNAATFAVAGQPLAGAHATLTNSWSIWNQGGTVRNDGHYSTGGTAPAIAKVTAGAGANATVSIAGNDIQGTITLNTSNSDTPSNNSDILTVTFNTAYAAAPKVLIMPANDATWALTYGIQWRLRDTDTTTALFKIRSGATALPATTTATYLWYYRVME